MSSFAFRINHLDNVLQNTWKWSYFTTLIWLPGSFEGRLHENAPFCSRQTDIWHALPKPRKPMIYNSFFNSFLLHIRYLVYHQTMWLFVHIGPQKHRAIIRKITTTLWECWCVFNVCMRFQVHTKKKQSAFTLLWRGNITEDNWHWINISISPR